MGRALFACLAMTAFAGCLSVTPPEVAEWPVEFASGTSVRVADRPVLGVTRVLQTIVRAPYGMREIAVLRRDGTIAFDPYNQYAAEPALLLKGVVFDALEASGLCQTVVGSSSSALAPTAVEVTFTRLGLDCRTEGERTAVVAVTVRILKQNEVVKVAKGAGAADAADGNYGKAISVAVSEALADALKAVR